MKLWLLGVFAAASSLAGCNQSDRAASDRARENAPLPASSEAQRAAPNACALLSAGEIAGAYGVAAVAIDSINSGRNEFKNVDLCRWYVTAGDDRGLMVKVRRAASPDDVTPTMLAARIDDNFSDPANPASPVAQVGDEATYRPYPDGAGGVLLVRYGLTVFTLDGSKLTKDALVALAKQGLART